MLFIPIKLDELKPGQAIYFPLYYSSGEMAVDAGFTPESEEQVAALVERGLCRGIPDPDEEQQEKEEGMLNNMLGQPLKPIAGTNEPAASPQRNADIRTLEQIPLKIGENIQLQFQSEAETERCIVTLIGYLANQGVIVSTPMLNGRYMNIREGQIFVVRMFSGKSAYAFTANTIKTTNVPFPHLHLSWPKEVRGLMIRGSSRAKTSIICHATLENGKSSACIARDISNGGALIAAKEKIGEVGDKLTLKMRFKINNAEHLLTPECTIRSANPAKGGEDEGSFMHGLSFHNLSSQDMLVISAVLYQNMMNDQQEEK